MQLRGRSGGGLRGESGTGRGEEGDERNSKKNDGNFNESYWGWCWFLITEVVG